MLRFHALFLILFSLNVTALEKCTHLYDTYRTIKNASAFDSYRRVHFSRAVLFCQPHQQLFGRSSYWFRFLRDMLCGVLLFWDQGVTLFGRGYLISCLLHIIFVSDGTATCQMNSTNVADFVLSDYLTFCGRDFDNNTTVLSCKYFGISNLFFSPIAMRYMSVCECMCAHVGVCSVNLEKESQSKKNYAWFHSSSVQVYTKQATRAWTYVAHL